MSEHAIIVKNRKLLPTRFFVPPFEIALTLEDSFTDSWVVSIYYAGSSDKRAFHHKGLPYNEALEKGVWLCEQYMTSRQSAFDKSLVTRSLD